MEYRPYTELDGVPNVIVDGAAHKDTALVLSHWANSGMNSEWLRRTSSEIVLNYLDNYSVPSHIQAVSNNHYDQDGLVAMFSLLEPDLAKTYRALLIDVAEAGDFGCYRQDKAVKIAMALTNIVQPGSGYFDEAIYSRPYAEQVAAFYRLTLSLLPKMLDDIEHFSDLWEDEYAFLSHSVGLIRDRQCGLEEDVANDLAVVNIPDGGKNVHRFEHNETHFGGIHEFAVHNATQCARVFYVYGRHIQFKFRYETWVKLPDNTHLPRVNLSHLAAALSELDSVRWIYDGSEKIVPLLRIDGGKESSLTASEVLAKLKQALQEGEVDWDPYPDISPC